jgi:hypothetical protein
VREDFEKDPIDKSIQRGEGEVNEKKPPIDRTQNESRHAEGKQNVKRNFKKMQSEGFNLIDIDHDLGKEPTGMISVEITGGKNLQTVNDVIANVFGNIFNKPGVGFQTVGRVVEHMKKKKHDHRGSQNEHGGKIAARDVVVDKHHQHKRNGQSGNAFKKKIKSRPQKFVVVRFEVSEVKS